MYESVIIEEGGFVRRETLFATRQTVCDLVERWLRSLPAHGQPLTNPATDFHLSPDSLAPLAPTASGPAPGRRRPPPALGHDQRQWINELLLTREIAILLGLDERPAEHVAQRTELWERLLLPRTALEVVRHFPATHLVGEQAGLVLDTMATQFASLYLDSSIDQLTPDLPWLGLLPLPVLLRASLLLKDQADFVVHLANLLAPQLPAESFEHDWLPRLREQLAIGGIILLVADDGLNPEQQQTVGRRLVEHEQEFPLSRIVVAASAAWPLTPAFQSTLLAS